MTSYVSAHLRREIESRANNLCEYCLIHEDDTFLGCQVDHIIAEKHGGTTESNNLSYACTIVLEGVLIQALTPAGEATANILGFNKEERILERAILSSVGRYPSAQTLAYISPRDQ
jgi:hypothetical protein